MKEATISVLGAGIQGCCLALALARRGHTVELIDRHPLPMSETSRHTEGKIHLGLVYAKDPRRATHRRMIRGSLAFADSLREIAGLEPTRYARGTRFHYVVPVESGLQPEDIATHFQRVEAHTLEVQAETGANYLGRRLDRVIRRFRDSELREAYDPKTVQAAFDSEEEAIDTLAMVSLLRDAVMDHPRIRFLGQTRVIDGVIESDGVRLVVEHADGRDERRYAAAANCLWAGRLALDSALGIAPPRPWLFRFKAIIRLQAPELAASPIPSATLVYGPFGDVVNYGNGEFYLSWYPSFKLGETRDLDGTSLSNVLDTVDHQQLARRGVEAMSRYIPGLQGLLEPRRDFQVGGGVIFSWGSTDIDDPGSGLHERWEIGPHRHGPYVSVDTGKYTMAPLFAVETRRILEEILA